jgi:hypothetical protein
VDSLDEAFDMYNEVESQQVIIPAIDDEDILEMDLNYHQFAEMGINMEIGDDEEDEQVIYEQQEQDIVPGVQMMPPNENTQVVQHQVHPIPVAQNGLPVSTILNGHQYFHQITSQTVDELHMEQMLRDSGGYQNFPSCATLTGPSEE